MSKEDNTLSSNHYVLKANCQNKHEKIDLALWGIDGRGGMVNDIGRMAVKVDSIIDHFNQEDAEKRKAKRDWRGFSYATIGGSIVAIVSWLLTHI